MDKALADLIRISNTTGKDPALVLGGGGNTSVKTEDGKHMYIKASGTALKDMNEQRGWRRLWIEPVLAIIQDKSLTKLDPITRENNVVSRLLDACEDNCAHGARPSVESHLHALLKTHVIHLHPLVVSAYVNAQNGQKELAKLFAGEKYPPLWVPYADPGYMLAKKIAALVERYVEEHGDKPPILFLEKHGVFVTADSAGGALKLVTKVIETCKSRIQTPRVPRIPTPPADEIASAKLMIRKAVFEVTGQYVPVSYFAPTENMAAFMAHKDAKALLDAPALHPEELVFSNGPALWIEEPDAAKIASKIQMRLDRTQKTPYAFVVKDFGLFIAADKSLVPLAAEMAEGSVTVLIGPSGSGKTTQLPKLCLLAGRGQYVDDLRLPRMVHVAFLRSPHAHARIIADRRAARRRPRTATP